MHTTDFMVNEVEEKLKIANLMKSRCQQQKYKSEKNLEVLKTAVDKTIAYHIETLKIRANW